MTRRHLHLALAAAGIAVWACGDSGSGSADSSGSSSGGAETGGNQSPEETEDPTANGSVSPEDVLASLADNVFAPTHVEFSESADALVGATQAYFDAVDGGADSQAARTELEAAYTTAMVAWQHVELLQVGPSANGSGIAGEFLRDEVYSWPAVNTCRIDQEIVADEFGAADFTDTRLVNVYGFDALEYLLFNESAENTCPPQLPINGDGSWAALSEADLAARRAGYAVTVASSIAAVADTLESTWAEGGTWHGYLTDPGSGPLESTQNAMDEVLRAMFYIDKTLKDVKLARPAGIRDCSSDVCLDEVESVWAGLSKEQAIANLEGFQRLMWAGASAEDGIGFDDLLGAIGEGALGAEMLEDTQSAIDAVAAIEGSFVEALTNDAAALDGAHAAVVELTDDLKGDFPLVLMLNIPTEAAGDAD